MSDFVDWEKPLPFVIIDEEKLQINQEAATLLSQIDQPAVIVGISGTYRKGKSYLMNRVAKKQKGFPVGNELQTETKGIWIWCLKHPKKPGTVLILLDSEGLDSCHENNRIQDMHIFTLTVLLSSAFIYNITEGIDANTIDRLYFVAELVKKIKINDTKDESLTLTDYSMHFPLFILAIRNFSLPLKKNGQKITPDEYFQDALALKKDDKSESSFNQPRRIIKSAFKRYHCFTFPFPVSDTDDTEVLESLPDDKLIPKFCKQCDEFCKFIYENAPFKKIGMANNATGQTFLVLTQNCVEKLNSGLDISLEPAISFVIEKQNTEVKKHCVQLYKDEMNKTKFPISDQDLMDFHNLANDKAMAYFRSHVFFDDEGNIFKEFRDLIPKEFEKFFEMNKMLSLEKCSKILDKLYEDELADKVSELYRSGGYKEYQDIVESILTKYDQQTKEETMSAQAKEKFLEKYKVENSSIMMADTAMTNMQKDQENQKKEKEGKLRKKKLVEKERQKENAHNENLLKKYQDDFRKLQSQMEKSEEETIQEFETIIILRKQEKDKLLNEGRREEAEELEYQIIELTKTIKRYKDKMKKKHLVVGALICGAVLLGVALGGAAVAIGVTAASGTTAAAGAGTVAATVGKEAVAKVAENAVNIVGKVFETAMKL